MGFYPRFLLLSIAALMLVLGCKKKDDENDEGTSAKATFEFENGTGLHLSDETNCGADICYTPIAYGLKILNILISDEEEGSTSQPAGLIWNNPDCGTTTQTSTIDDTDYEYDTMEDCNDDDVDDYFDLARTTDEVNEDLNSQQYKIIPGTYHYIQMGFCMNSPQSQNAEFQTEDMPEPFQAKSGTCGITSAKAETPIEVGEGDSVTIQLSYDLTEVISEASEPDEDSCYVSDDESIIRCFGFPANMEPSFVED